VLTEAVIIGLHVVVKSTVIGNEAIEHTTDIRRLGMSE
jgi:hypothetical protein